MQTTVGAPVRGGLRSLARALAHRNYRLFFAGQAVSLVGTWMTRIATGWLVFRLGGPDSALLLGAVSFVGQSPAFFLGPFTGVLVDRWDRHRLLVLTQAAFAVLAALLAGVAFGGWPAPAAVWAVTALSLLQGVVNAFDMPARQAFLVEMVTRKEDLGNAIALNSSLVNGARLVGPSLAGVLIALAGEGWCFLIDAVSYLAVIAALLAMKVPGREPSAAEPQEGAAPDLRREVGPAAPRRRRAPEPVWRALREGFAYAFGFAPIRTLLLLLALVSFMGMPYTVLLPIFAERLGGGPYTLGFLSAASGVGALTGALHLASRRTVLGLGRAIVFSTAVFGLGLMGFAFSPWLWLALALMVLVGLGMMVQMAASNTILQTIVEEDKRGRVMSFYSMAFLGMAPFGSLFAGGMAHLAGPGWTVFVGGLSCLLAAALFAARLPRLRELVRPLYQRLGVLPEVAAGLQSATELTRRPEE
jgi:MFS family permease